MPDAYGFTAEGFVPKTTSIIAADIRRQLGGLYPGANLGPKTYLGAKADIVADVAGAVWDELQVAVASADPDAAEDAALEVVASYHLVTRQGPSFSSITLTLTGVPGTLVTSDARAAIPDTTVAFELVAPATILTDVAWFTAEAVVVGDRRHRLGNVYICSDPGVTSGGPSGTGTAIADGSAAWDFLGPGTGSVDAPAFAVETGPVEAPARSVIEPGTPIAGWLGVVNLEDAAPGALTQSDESLRVTNEAALIASGDGTPEGIRSNLLLTLGVRGATVFVNRTDATDADGVPPHSVEALVTGGDEQLIAEVLYRSVADGINWVGGIVRTVIDSEGYPQEVRFARPTQVPVWVTVTVRRDPKRFDATTGPDEVRARIIAYGDSLPTGTDSDAFALAGQVAPRVAGGVVREAVPGVTSVASLYVGAAPAPAAISLAITRRQFADYDTSHITVVQVDPT